MSNQMQEVLADSGPNQFDMDFFDDRKPMTRAEFIMAQVDLDPIKSEYSEEMKLRSQNPAY